MMVVGLIPAAGRGERLRPLTDRIPKPLIKVCGKPLILHAIEHLNAMGVDEIVVALHYKKEKVMEFLSQTDVQVKYCYPDKLLGLAYTIYSAKNLINETFVVHLADNIFMGNCKYALDEHIKRRADATLLIEKGDPEGRYEAIRLERGRILDIVEKAEFSYGYRGTGIYIFEPIVFEYCKNVKKSDRGELELQDAIKNMINDGRKVLGVLLKGRRVEVTTEEDIRRAEEVMGCEK